MQEIVTGSIGIALMVIATVLAVFWIIFPLMVWSRMDQMIKLLDQIRVLSLPSLPATGRVSPPSWRNSRRPWRAGR